MIAHPMITDAIPATAPGTRRLIRDYLRTRYLRQGAFIFTKLELRIAIGDFMTEGFGRRMRDLRDEGYVIDTYREDPALRPAEHRLVRVPPEQ